MASPASAYIPGSNGPNVDKRHYFDNIRLLKTSQKLSEHIVAKKKFHQSARPRLDNIMIEGGDDVWMDRYISIWIAKALAFIRTGSFSHCRKQRRNKCPICNNIAEKELAFFQYFHVFSEDKFVLNEVDKSLNRIRII